MVVFTWPYTGQETVSSIAPLNVGPVKTIKSKPSADRKQLARLQDVRPTILLYGIVCNCGNNNDR